SPRAGWSSPAPAPTAAWWRRSSWPTTRGSWGSSATPSSSRSRPTRTRSSATSSGPAWSGGRPKKTSLTRAAGTRWQWGETKPAGVNPAARPDQCERPGLPRPSASRSLLLRAHVELALHLGRRALDLDLLAEAALGPALEPVLVPVDDAELAGGCVLDLEVPVLVGDRVVRVVEDPHVPGHPPVDRALVLDRGALGLEGLRHRPLGHLRDGNVVLAVGRAAPEEVVGHRGRVLDHQRVAGPGHRHPVDEHAARLVDHQLRRLALGVVREDLVLGELGLGVGGVVRAQPNHH